MYWHRSYYEWVIADLWSMWVYHLISYVFYWGPVCQFCDCPLIVWRLSKDQNKWSRPVVFWMSDPATLNSEWVIPPRVLTPVILWVGNRRFLIHVTLSPHISCPLSRTGVSILWLPTHSTTTLEESKRVIPPRWILNEWSRHVEFWLSDPATCIDTGRTMSG